MAGKVTQAAVAALKPGETIRDSAVSGFGARRQANAISFFLQTRIRGRLKWISIGKAGSPWTVDQARRRARELLVEIERGGDPTVKLTPPEVTTFDMAADLFLEEHGPKLAPKSLDDYARMLRLHARPRLGKIDIAEIDHSDINRLHLDLKHIPRSANLTLSVLGKMMSWAALRKFRAGDNPCRGVKRYKERRRERFLTDEELKRLAAALADALTNETESLYVVAAIRLLLMTGCRLNEILTLQWAHIDLQRGLIYLPTSKTGQKPVYLSSAALQVLQDLPRLENNPYAIVGERQGRHLVNLQKAWTRIRAAAGLEDVRLHDLRHTFASLVAADGASLLQVGALLGHMSPTTTKRYAHLVADPLHAFNEAIGAKLSGVFNARPAETDD